MSKAKRQRKQRDSIDNAFMQDVQYINKDDNEDYQDNENENCNDESDIFANAEDKEEELDKYQSPEGNRSAKETAHKRIQDIHEFEELEDEEGYVPLTLAEFYCMFTLYPCFICSNY